VIWEWNDGCAHSQYHGRVDLTMAVSAAVLFPLVMQILREHCEHYRLLLKRINVLHNSACNEVLPAAKVVK